MSLHLIVCVYTDCKPKMNRCETLSKGCKHDKQLLVRCNEADFELSKCENVYNCDQSFDGNVPSRCMGWARIEL
jgi:hypothetical protein